MAKGALQHGFGWGRLAAHLRTPLYSNAFALMLSTLLSAALGVVYWVLAARFYPSAAVGQNAALISAMIFLSGVSQLNLTSALIGFIPTAGAATPRLVGYSYLTSLLVTALPGGLLMLAVGAGWQMPGLAGVGVPFLGAFLLATICWSIFTLQDNVLMGLQQAVWVPIENIAYGVAKLVLLVALAERLPTYGIFVSWVLPMMASIVPINALIFRRLIPAHIATHGARAKAIGLGQISRYVAANYVGSLFALASARLLPVLVAYRAGPNAAAHFFLAWTIANSLKLVSTNMTASLTVEGSADPAALKRHTRTFLLLLVGLFLPMVAVVVLAAPLALGLSGGEYAAEGSTVLRLLVFSTIPGIVTALALGVAQAQRRIWTIMAVQGAFALLVLGLSYALLPAQGVAGVGIAMLVSETVLALLLLVTQLLTFFRPTRRPQQGG